MVGITELEFVRELARRVAGIAIRDEQQGLIEVRLRAFAAREGYASPGDMLRSLRRERHEAMEHRLVETVANQETWFFRERRLLETVRSRIVPALLKARAGRRPIHIWMAACSTGQEPYTVAMQLHRDFGPETETLFRLIASDLSQARVEYARAGVYTQMEVNRGLPAALLVDYFSQHGLEWRLRDDVRRLVSFRRINLARDSPPFPMDVVMLTNVLYYLETQARREVLHKVYLSLRPDGYLLTSSAEARLDLEVYFDKVQNGASVYYQPRSASAGRAASKSVEES